MNYRLIKDWEKEVRQQLGKKKVKREYKEEILENIDYVKSIIPYSYYNENIFCPEDFYLYRGVLNMYIGEYDKAWVDFNKSLAIKAEAK